MKMDKVAGSGNDEFFTPPYAVEAILPFVPEGAVVWCPFDTEDSHFVKLLREKGHKVIATHLADGYDFFTHVPSEPFTHVISNPPYSMKTEVLERLFKSSKPFAMLVGVVGLFESQRRFEMFRDNDFEVLYLNRRVAYFKDYAEQKPSLNPPFSSVYICRGMLPEKICFTEIKKIPMTPQTEQWKSEARRLYRCTLEVVDLDNGHSLGRPDEKDQVAVFEKSLLAAHAAGRKAGLEEAMEAVRKTKAFEETHSENYYGFCHQLDKAISAISSLIKDEPKVV